MFCFHRVQTLTTTVKRLPSQLCKIRLLTLCALISGYAHMLCVEAAAATMAVDVPGGQAWSGWQTLHVVQ